MKIKKATEKSRERSINISNPIPVHILYITAWADEDGLAYFRKDIYERDQPLLKALKQDPPQT